MYGIVPIGSDLLSSIKIAQQKFPNFAITSSLSSSKFFINILYGFISLCMIPRSFNVFSALDISNIIFLKIERECNPPFL